MSGFVDGLTAGINNGLRVMQFMDGRDQRERLNARQDKEWAEQDRQKELVKGANEAARKAFEGSRSAFDESNKSNAEERINLTLGGAQQEDARSLASPGGLTLGGQQAPAANFGDTGGATLGNSLSLSAQAAPIPTEQLKTRPTAKYDERDGVLAGLVARRKYLMSNGADMGTWMDDWGKESQLRAQMRGERIDNAEKRFMATGDPGEYAKAVYPLIDDGMEFVGTKPAKTVDGQEAWDFIRRDPETGKEVTSTMTAPQFQQLMLTVRDPKAMATYEAKSLLERLKADEGIRKKQGEEAAVRETNRQKSVLRLGEIDAEGKQSRKTVAARGAEDRATTKAKPLTLSEGQVAVAPGKDGKYEPVAEGKPKSSGARSFTVDGRRYREDADGTVTELPLPKKRTLGADSGAPSTSSKPTTSNW